MIELIDLCLKQYHYINSDDLNYDDLWFYKKADKNIVSYFLIHYIDCTDFETNSVLMKSALEKLEIMYSGKHSDFESVKIKIQNSFESTQEASQIDKNTSAIYLLKFKNIKNLDIHRNLVYAIEESPNYFKRYILPYTQEQVDGIKAVISDYETLNINEVLSDIAYDEDEYYKLMDGQNVGSIYELVIRLFSKLPFLQYRFTASIMPKSIEEDVIQKVKEQSLEKYHNTIGDCDCIIDNLLALVPDTAIKNDVIEREIKKLLGGNN